MPQGTLAFASPREGPHQPAMCALQQAILGERPAVSIGGSAVTTLALEQMPLAELMEAARQHGIADLSSVRLAVLEPSGKISFIEEP